ncbi:uncharacterized protein LOC6639638 isoform X1 [Drosophila willistoni]|uniref:uncharacterized protein LOC6639638 isoform X1 n=2 Tax=Drosophila willistoni TaxID=7260 RepID=UPI000C26D487|nr:uncharacterized protein LOC6639638 isoform X1 [Drosophila willistoni]
MSKMFRSNLAMMCNTRRHTVPPSEEHVSDLLDMVEGESELDGRSLMSTLSRTPLLLIDYVQFKAARSIQSYWRAFRIRQLLNKRTKAAVTIQSWWRGTMVRKSYLRMIENMLQQRIEERFNKAAIKIQALFRGWFVRQTVHDMHSLRRMQVGAAEDLLNCVAFKLHHLLRTYSIPGVYSIRNSNCLSRVEKLLASLNFRFHNGRVRAFMAKRMTDVRGQRQRFTLNSRYTEVPYHGPNFMGLCRPQPDQVLHHTKDLDRRMFKIIELYEESQRDNKAQQVYSNLAEKKRRKQIDKILAKHKSKRRDFCGDVINSMRRWKIWDEQKLLVDQEVFRDPNNLEKFLHEISEILAEIDGRSCYCSIPVYDEIYCL